MSINLCLLKFFLWLLIDTTVVTKKPTATRGHKVYSVEVATCAILISNDCFIECMDEERQLFSSGGYDLYEEVEPDVDSLRVEAEIVDMVGDSLGTRSYDGDSLPSHIECESCGQRIRLGWAIEEAIEDREEEIDVYVSCSGEMRGGRSCLYGIDIEGSVSYTE